jgi:hypothetical protein
MTQGTNLPLLKVLASPFVTLHQILTVGDDCWTWTTLNGDAYEDVVILDLTATDVTIEHKYGVSTLLRSELAPHIQKNLAEHSLLADSAHLDYMDKKFSQSSTMAHAA